MTEERTMDLRRARLMDFSMESALGFALASYVLFHSVPLSLAVLCGIWVIGMRLIAHIER